MKKKVLFILSSFGIGGTTVSTKNLILTLDSDRYEMFVMPMKDEGALREMFSDVRQIRPSFALSTLSGGFRDKQAGVAKRILASILRFTARRIRYIQKRIFVHTANSVMNRYQFDTVVACKENKVTLFASHFKCANKIAWVRCDYQRYAKKLKSERKEYDIYKTFNSVVCVSEITSKNFTDIFPEFADKTYAINNPQSGQYILNQSENDDCDSRFAKEGLTLLSIGRIDPVKRFSYIPAIASELTKKGLDFRWYIVGGGSQTEYDRIVAEIVKHSVSDRVICLGAKANPHFYIGHSDLLVCLSSSEACPRVINEAKILHTPVVCADFPTAKEFIDSGTNGIICPINEMTDNIYCILTDKGLRDRIKANVAGFQFDNVPILKQLDKIL